MDIAKRSALNPILRPSDFTPAIEGMEIACLLNPGVFVMDGRICMIIRVAERPEQKEGKRINTYSQRAIKAQYLRK